MRLVLLLSSEVLLLSDWECPRSNRNADPPLEVLENRTIGGGLTEVPINALRVLEMWSFSSSSIVSSSFEYTECVGSEKLEVAALHRLFSVSCDIASDRPVSSDISRDIRSISTITVPLSSCGNGVPGPLYGSSGKGEAGR
jgi:hypothetical protein